MAIEEEEEEEETVGGGSEGGATNRWAAGAYKRGGRSACRTTAPPLARSLLRSHTLCSNLSVRAQSIQRVPVDLRTPPMKHYHLLLNFTSDVRLMADFVMAATYCQRPQMACDIFFF